MRTTRYVVAGLVVGALAAAGCGDDTDPLAQLNTDTSRDAGAASDSGATDDSRDGTPDGGSLPDGGAADSGGEDSGSTDGGGTDSGTPDVGVDTTPGPDSGGGDAGSFACGEGVVFTGQVFRTADEPAISPNGGIPSFEPYDAGYDAGVAALIAAGVPDGTATVEIAVTEATVVATSFNNDTALRAQSQFYIADANGTIEVRLAQDDTDAQPAFPIIVGQKISFTATEMGWFGDFPQVAAGTGFTLISENNPVAIYEPEGDTPLTFDDAPRVVRITGELIASEGACGGSSFCYTFDYGASANITLRSSSSFLEVGDCATFVGPMSSFNEAPQVNTTNFDWLFDYTRNE